MARHDLHKNIKSQVVPLHFAGHCPIRTLRSFARPPTDFFAQCRTAWWSGVQQCKPVIDFAEFLAKLLALLYSALNAFKLVLWAISDTLNGRIDTEHVTINLSKYTRL